MATADPTAPTEALYRMIVPAPAGPKKFTAQTIQILIAAFERWRDETGFGASEIGARFPVHRDGTKIGEVSYNGRWWPSLEVPAAISPSVSCLRLSEALARAGLVGLYDAHRGLLVIEPAVQDRARCLHCGGTGFEEDSVCEFCGGAGRGWRSASPYGASMSAAGIVAGELSEVRRALKRTWNALSVARLPIGHTDFVSGCIDRAVDQATAAISVLEGGWNPAEVYRTRVAVSVPTVIGQLDDARRVIRKAREALRVPYLDGFLDRAQDQTSTVIRALTQEAEAGMAWYNALTEAERGHWHRVADSAVPADAWKAYQRQAEEAHP